MKILIAGDWHSELHEEAVYHALSDLGHAPIKFPWHQYFRNTGSSGRWVTPLLRIQNKYMIGPQLFRLNRDLVDLAIRERPNVVFVYRGTHIFPATLRRLHESMPSVILVGYNNDDPFSPQYPPWKWRHFLAGVPEYDLVLAYRDINIGEYKALGAKRVDLLRSWFIPKRNFPMKGPESESRTFDCDVIFVGHFEEDGRMECLEEIVRRGWRLNIYGPGYEWDSRLRESSLLRGHAPVRLVWGCDYNRVLCGARAALCFLSKLNRDTYTRRCFEIPASGSVLVSEHTEDLASMFIPDKEVILFRDKNDLVDRLSFLLANEEARWNIAQAGMRRVWADGHDIYSRMRLLMESIERIFDE